MTTYADGATATIQVASGVNTSQSGLTPGAKYYVQPYGSLSTTPAAVSVLAGTAISATKFLVSSSLITAHPDPELPAPGASGKILKSDGTNWVSGDEAELPAAGAANKGAGGGGRGGNNEGSGGDAIEPGGNGGSGFVVIRYLTSLIP